MGKLADTYVEVSLNQGPLNSQLSTLGGSLATRLGMIGSAAGTAFSSAFTVGATAGIAALAGGIGIAGITTKLASNAEEAASKFGYVFDVAGEKTAASLDTFSAAAGRSKFAMREMAADIGALVKPMGFTSDQTGEMSVKVTKLATDLASFFNSTDAEALTALRAGLVGESEPLRRFGVQLNEARIQSQAMSMGLAKTKDDVKGAVKAMAIMAIVEKDTAAATGDAVRTAGSFANSLKAMQGSFQDLGVEVGQLFLPSMTAVVQAIRSMVGAVQANTGILKEWGATLGEISRNVIGGLSEVASMLASTLGAGLNSVLANSSQGGITSFKELVDSVLGNLAILTTNWQSTWELMKTAASFAVNELKIAIASGLQFAYAVAAGQLGGIVAVAEAAFGDLKSFVSLFGVEFTAVFEGLQAVIESLAKTALNHFGSIAKLIPGIAKQVVGALAEIKSSEASTISSVFATARDTSRAANSAGIPNLTSTEDYAKKYRAGYQGGFGGAMASNPLTSMIEGLTANRGELQEKMKGLFTGMAAERDAKKPPPAGAAEKALPSAITSALDTLKKGLAAAPGFAVGALVKGSVGVGKRSPNSILASAGNLMAGTFFQPGEFSRCEVQVRNARPIGGG